MTASADPYIIQKIMGKEPLGGSKYHATISLVSSLILFLVFIVSLIYQRFFTAIVALILSVASIIKYLVFKRQKSKG